MKKIFNSLVLIFVLVSLLFTVSALAETGFGYEIGDSCEDMIEKWYGEDTELLSMNEGSEADKAIAHVQNYMKLRAQSVYDRSELKGIDYVSDEVLKVENERRAAFAEMEENMLIEIVDADNHTSIKSATKTEKGYDIVAYDFVFYEYDDLETEVDTILVAGFGIDHFLSLEKSEEGYVIVSDIFDESTMNGIYTTDTAAIDIEAEDDYTLSEVENEDDTSILMWSYDYSYDPEAAVAYAYEYTDNSGGTNSDKYNDDWPNYNSSGGDCTNFVSQCLYAGGMEQDDWRSSCTMGCSCCWFHRSSSNRSGSWTTANCMIEYMGNNRGNRIDDTRSSSDIYYGSPVFYDWYGDGRYDHTTICVGVLDGTPVVNSHNNNYVNKKWNYGYGATIHSTVQLTSYNLKKPAVVDRIPVTGMQLNSYDETLVVGETFTLKPIIYPTNATDKSVTWESDDKSTATVSSSGKVTAQGEGCAIITARSKDNPSVYSQCAIWVVNPVSVTGISVYPSSVTLDKGDTETLTATVYPSDASDKSVTWKSSSTSVATVSSSGKITAKGYGTATITATTNDGGYTDTCTVTVKYYYPEDITLNRTSLELDLDEMYTLKATISPSNVTNDKIIWSSSNTNVATVSSTGKITAQRGGECYITATCQDKDKYGYTVSASCYVKVIYIPEDGVTLNKTSLTLSEGASETLIATVSPSNATYKEVEWYSSDKSVVTVSSSGKVTAKGKGTTWVYVKTKNLGYTAYCSVTVEHIYPTGISLDKEKLELATKETYTLKATISPYNVSNDKIIWESSDPSVATVSSAGKVTAKGNGTAIIYATCDDTAENGQVLYDSCSVTVREYVYEINGSKLIVRGKGVIEDFTNEIYQPWYSYRNSITEIEIAKGITRIGDNSFRGMTKVKKVTIPTTVKEIGYAAFYNCTALSEVDSLEKVVRFEDYAFRGCTSLYTIDIENGLTYIGEYAFDRTGYANNNANWTRGGLYVGKNLVQTNYAASAKFTVADGTVTVAKSAFEGAGTKLTEVIIADSVKTICPGAFADCGNVETITLGQNIKAITLGMFDGCINLENFALSTKNKTFAVEDGVLYKKGLSAIIRYPEGRVDETLVLPEKVTTIAGGAFLGCDLDEIVLPAKLKTIDVGAFSACYVETIQYMKYEKDWAKVKIGAFNDALENADFKFLVAVEEVTFDFATKNVGLKKGYINLGGYVNVYPSNATNKDVTWKSSSTKIAKVDEDGFVTFLKAGNVTITATSVEGKKTATCKITVIDDMIHVTEVRLDESAIELDVADDYSIRLIATVLPYNADNDEITWKSSKTSVAVVSQDGIVTPVKKGTATITAESVDGKKKATCKVTVVDSTVYATKVTLDTTKISIYEGEEFELTATLAPEDVTFDYVTWTSSKASVATVDENGVVTAIKKGTATITATSADGKKKATCKVTVLDPTIYATKVTLDTTKETLYVGDEIQLEATIAPANVTHDYVTWKSSKSSVATVDENGVVTAIKKGTATITATSADGKKKATCKITVKD